MRQAVSDGQAVQVLFDDEEDLYEVYLGLEHGELAELEQRMDFEESEGERKT